MADVSTSEDDKRIATGRENGRARLSLLSPYLQRLIRVEVKRCLVLHRLPTDDDEVDFTLGTASEESVRNMVARARRHAARLG